MANIESHFHQFVRDRLPARMTVAEFSRKTGISRSQVDGWIKNGVGSPGIDMLEKIAEALDCDPRHLLMPPDAQAPETKESILGALIIDAATLEKNELSHVRDLAKDFVARRTRKSSELQQK